MYFGLYVLQNAIKYTKKGLDIIDFIIKKVSNEDEANKNI